MPQSDPYKFETTTTPRDACTPDTLEAKNRWPSKDQLASCFSLNAYAHVGSDLCAPARASPLSSKHKRHSASRCCDDSPHDDPSCLCGSFEDQTLAFGVLFGVGPKQDLQKGFHVWVSTVLLWLRSCELPVSHYEEAWSTRIFVESMSSLLQSPSVGS